MQHANGSNIVAVIVKLGCVVKDQNCGIGRCEPIARGLKMPRQNTSFGNTMIREKAIRRLCVCPVLANQRNALASALGKLLEKYSEPLLESDVSELAPCELAITTGSSRESGRADWDGGEARSTDEAG